MNNISIKQAREYAVMAHGDQKYGDDPYSKHLDDVYKVLVRFKTHTNDLVKAAYLHDVLEDTHVKYKQLEEIFGYKVANLVFAVTDGEGKNREERKVESYRKIRALGKEAMILKVADRIANVERCIEYNNYSLFTMYYKEHLVFQKNLKVSGTFEGNLLGDMWKHLDNLIWKSENKFNES